MSKEITKAYILQQLEDKLKLREFAAAPFLFDETVVPVYNIEQHLGTWHVVSDTESITSAAGVEFFAVPMNERWVIRGYYVLFLGAGAIKVSGVYISRQPETDTLYLDLKKNQEVSYIVNLPEPVVVEAATKIGVLVDTYVSTQNLTIKLDVRKEEIR